jgi:hypothetical protein
MTGTLSIKNTSSLVQAPYQSDHDFPNGAYIQTDIAPGNGEPWTCEITAFNYGGGRPTKITINGYNYGPGTYYAGYAIATGLGISGMSVFQNASGYLCLYIPSQGYWNAYNVNWYVNYRTNSSNRVTSITNSTKPTGISYENAVNPTYSLDQANYNSYTPTLTGGGASGNWAINSTNITAYTINQSVGTANAPTFAGLTVNTGGTGTWGPFVVNSTSLWGDGSTLYATIGAGGAAGIMIFNPHVVWNSSNSAAAIRMGRSGGVSTGAYYEIGTGASDNFFIAKNALSNGTQFNITSSGNITITNNLAVNNTSPYDTAQFSLDINGGLLVKNTGKTAQFVLQNANPASGGNNGFVVHTAGGTTTGAYAAIQTYYGASIVSGTLQLQPSGGIVTINGYTAYHAGNIPTFNQNTTGYATSLYIGGSSSKLITDAVWAGTGGYPGYSFTGGNSRFGFSSSSGVIDVYADGNFYATDSGYLVLHTGNYSSYVLPLSGGSLSGNLGMGSSMITYTSYDTPNMIVAGAGDTNWTFGSSHADASNYWMQVKFYGTGDDNRGFRILDKNGDVIRFRVNGAGHAYVQNNLYAGNALITPNIYSGGGNVNFGNNVSISPSSASWAEGLAFTMPSSSTWGGLRWRRERAGYDGNWAVGYTALDSSDDLVFIANDGGAQINNILRLSKGGIVSAKYGYVSYSNPWGTADSAYFPNGITTAGGTNWIYGTTYIGNAPSNGNGCQLDASGNARFTGQLTLSNYQVGVMQSGALNIGRIDTNYRWDGTTWANDVRVGILANCLDYWELAVHNSGQSVMSGLYYDGGSTFYIGRSIGWGTCSLIVGGDVTAYSDISVKENIRTIDNALNKTLALRGTYFNRTDTKDTRTKIGFIAQEVQQVAPELVSEMEDGLLGVSYGNTVALLVEAIKELKAEIDELKSQK